VTASAAFRRGGQRVADRPQHGPRRGRHAQHRDERQRGPAHDGQRERRGQDEHADAGHRQVHRSTAGRGGQRAADREQDPGGGEGQADLPGRDPGGVQPGRDEQGADPGAEPGGHHRGTGPDEVTVRRGGAFAARMCLVGRGRSGRHPEHRQPGGDHGEDGRGDQQRDGQPQALGECAGDRRPGDAADAGAGHGAAQGRRAAGHRAGQPAQARGPHHAVAGPEGQPGREQDREVAGQRLRRASRRHQQARGQRDTPGAEPVGQGPGRHGHDQGGEPGRAEHHALLEPGQAEPVGVHGHDRHQGELGGRAHQDQGADQQAEQPALRGGPGGLQHDVLLVGL
jgi:hypothetical protein